MEVASSSICNLGILGTLAEESIDEILHSYTGFCAATEALLSGSRGNFLAGSELVPHVHGLCKYGLSTLVVDHFLRALEETFEKNGASKFWQHFESYRNVEVLKSNEDHINEDEIQQVLCEALDEVSTEKQFQEKCLLTLVHTLQTYKDDSSDAERAHLFSKYQLSVSSVLMANLPRHFPEILHWYFKRRLEELSTIMDGEFNDESETRDKDEMDIDECHRQGKFSENNKLVKNIGKVVRSLRSLAFTSMTEDAYASAIFLLLKDKVRNLADDDYRNSVLDPIKSWIQAVPLQFLNAPLAYLGDSVNYGSPSSALISPLSSHSPCYPGNDIPSEGLVRWRLRLEYFAYETLQDLRIAKLFEIIVDYPESSPAIEDLKQCLDYTGQHSKLVESFISALKYRLLTAGASTNDILHQYVSTIKALRRIDPAGVFLEAVSEPIKEYLRARKDTIKCIVIMLTGGTGGNPNGPGSSGDSLLEELNRDEENQENIGVDDDHNTDDKQAWLNAMRWEPDPVEADHPMKVSRNKRKVDILGMIVDIIGSKDQLVNEYRVMLSEKLLNKSDYDIDSEIRTVELLKIHFGESSMQRCEIMLNDLIDSKRTNTNIKATINKQSQSGVHMDQTNISLDILDVTILSSNFWPPIQEESLVVPEPVDQLLTDYANRFHEIKKPRKLLWKKNLGLAKLELQFEDRVVQFTVAPIHAAIIMHFQDQGSWTSKNLAAAIGVPVDILNRRIIFWISKGILSESLGTDSEDHVFTLVEGMGDSNKSGGNGGSCEDLLAGEDEGERTVASVEDQIRKEMTVYEKFIMGMLTNFGSMALDRIHNTLKMFCVADPPYDKSLQQLQSFLSGLVSEEKVELRDGMYVLKK